MNDGTKHTPGPWKANNWASGWEVSAPDSHYTVCRLSGCNNAGQNARLIAAAPELLEACKALLKRLGYYTHDTETCDLGVPDERALKQGREAIAKAEQP